MAKLWSSLWVIVSLGCGGAQTVRIEQSPQTHDPQTTVGAFRNALLQRCGPDALWCAVWLCPDGTNGRERIGGADAFEGCVFSDARTLDAHNAGSVMRSITRPLYESENGFVDVLTSGSSGVYGPPRMVISGTLDNPIAMLHDASFREPGTAVDAAVQRYLIAYRELPETGFLGSLAGVLAHPPQQMPGFHMPTPEEFGSAFNDAFPPNHRYGRIESCVHGANATLVLEVSATGDVARAFATHAEPSAEACLMQIVVGAHMPFGPSWFAIVL